MSRTAFNERFPDDAACARHLFEKRWPNGFICPKCQGAKAWALDYKRFTYQCAACDRQTLPADTAVRENGPGQYEVNLKHVDAPVSAAAHASGCGTAPRRPIGPLRRARCRQRATPRPSNAL